MQIAYWQVSCKLLTSCKKPVKLKAFNKSAVFGCVMIYIDAVSRSLSNTDSNLEFTTGNYFLEYFFSCLLLNYLHAEDSI